MHRFIYKTLVFLLFLTLFFGINMVVNYIIYNNQAVPIAKTSILIAGDSHPQLSLNPTLFKDAQNISQPAEPYILTFWKLKDIYQSYTPDTLILGFSPHNISQFNDLKFSNKLWSGEMFKRSYPIQEFRKISDEIDVDYLQYFQILWKQTAFYPKKDHVHFLGYYSNSNESDISDWDKATKRHYFYHKTKLGVSTTSVNYLDSIVHLTASKNIKLIMAGHPLHEKYLKNIPSNIMREYDRLAQKYRTNQIVLNKTREKYPDSLYLNSDHLNEVGAKRFTKELIEHLK